MKSATNRNANMREHCLILGLLIAAVAISLGLWWIWGNSVPFGNSRNLGARNPGDPQLDKTTMLGEAALGADAYGSVSARRVTSEASTGTVEVKAEYDDGAVANGLGVVLRRFGMDLSVGVLRGTTNTEGRCSLVRVPVGDYLVSTSIGTLDHMEHERIQVIAGETKSVELVIPAQFYFRGKVVDSVGRPIGGAEIWMGEPARTGPRAEIVARTDGTGTFEFRSMLVATIVWARAHRYSPSSPQFLPEESQLLEPFIIVLPGAGGNVRGRIVDYNGEPVCGGVVRVGDGRLDATVAAEGGKPLPSEAISDEHGQFLVIGLPVGSQPVVVRAAQFRPWQGQCTVVPDGDVSLEVVMERGGSVSGRVILPDGSGVPGAYVECGAEGTLLHYRCLSDGLGHYDLQGLPFGEMRLRARSRSKGRGEVSVTLTLGESATADIIISKGSSVIGLLQTQKSTGVRDANIQAIEEGKNAQGAWFQYVRTDKSGQFVLTNVPEGKPISIYARHESIYDVARRHVDSAIGHITLIARERPIASAFVVGRIVVGGRGGSRPPARVVLTCEGVHNEEVQVVSEDQDGRFSFGPVPPGAYTLCVTCGVYAAITRHSDVPAGGRWDVGDIVLDSGGKVCIMRKGEWPDGLFFGIWDQDNNWVTSVRGKTEGAYSEPLEPGRYVLSTLGDGIAREVEYFTVVSGEVTSVAMAVHKGVPVRLVVPDMQSGDAFTWRIRAGGRVIMQRPCFADASGFSHVVALLPGMYTVECECVGHVHEVSLDVKESSVPQEIRVSYHEIAGR